ncbi:MAG: tRNA uridine(34) 5-carboxymethylaminomethyl modification radical SAM/GNAT enzyme Elp3 [Coriobacteriia bacterium]|nr:tRNA uridine(34) 5-carboxymethylaminomethyl modification radical SAM/GNAT enzyme Elp3 [Coriobacteriia bacterium]
MEHVVADIIAYLRAEGCVDAAVVERTIRAHNQGICADAQHHSKKKVVEFYLRQKAEDTALWRTWALTPAEQDALAAVLRMKPRRTASGVATITVITKPQPCGSACLYCPNDVRMPKSYLTNEPACQRAERNYFDPYLQVASRLRALTHMGHTTDKVELIILGGTWSDYLPEYQIWFVTRLFEALNQESAMRRDQNCRAVRARYAKAGVQQDAEALAAAAADVQRQVDEGALTYNQAVRGLYGPGTAWEAVAAWQQGTWEQLEAQQAANVKAAHRVVGLVMETRPDAISAESLTLLRRMGATKVQMGIQSLDQRILQENNRGASVQDVQRAFALLRLFGFKTHVHTMLNLKGATPESDKADYARLVGEAAFLPDEVKLYPCALVKGTGLQACYANGTWRPYTYEELMDVLVADTLATPAYTRISRMIRDIGAGDILVGNKLTNLRQMVEQAVRETGERYQEIRLREVSTGDVALEDLSLQVLPYDTTVSQERFLQWVAPNGRLAGFCRLSLPSQTAVRETPGLPVSPGQAMIREVHVYGTVAGLHKTDGSAQHAGLGRALVEKACELAAEAGYASVNVISSVGTRDYYRKLGFADAGLYQRREL